MPMASCASFCGNASVSANVGLGFRQPKFGVSLVDNSLRIHNNETIREPTVRSLRETTVLEAAPFTCGGFIASAVCWSTGCGENDGIRNGRKEAQKAQKDTGLCFLC